MTREEVEACLPFMPLPYGYETKGWWLRKNHLRMDLVVPFDYKGEKLQSYPCIRLSEETTQEGLIALGHRAIQKVYIEIDRAKRLIDAGKSKELYGLRR